MKKFRQLFVILLFVSINPLFAQNYRVIKRERPAINFERVSKDSYFPNKIRIKINPDYQEMLSEQVQKNKEGLDIIGIENVDKLSLNHNVKIVKKPFEVILNNKKYEGRHKAWGFHLWYELEFKDEQNIVELIKQYCEFEEIAFAEPVFKKQLIDDSPITERVKWIPNDPMFSQQWHYHNTGQQSGTPGADIDLVNAWEIQTGDPSVIVAIIDGGIQHNHPDIQANMWSGIGYNFVTNSTTIQPHDHGTHVAGTISAVNHNGLGVSGIAGGSGLGDGVRLMSCQVFGPYDNGGFELAPVWAADNGAVISQNSWGYTSAGYYEQAVLDAIDYFNQNAGSEAESPMDGGITIFAAGNSNSTGQWYPACYSGVMSVAATNNNDQKAWYSNYDTWVDISAPGGETNSVEQRGVLSTVTGNGYGYKQGTSMACPHVSGVAALLLSHAPGQLTPEELKDVVKETADNHYAQNPSFIGMLGSGRLNAASALGEVDAMLTGLRNPKNFKAIAISSDEIDLSWTRNDSLNSVIVAFSTSPTFGTPTSSALPGETVDGGGTILYVGADTLFVHNNLNSVTTYFYRIWSFTDEGELSTGRGTSATTLCSNFELPFNEYANTTTLPLCWSTQWEGGGSQSVWSISNTSYAGGIAGEFRAKYVSETSTSRLVTPAINTTGIAQITLRFKHFYDDYSSGLTFRVQTSNDGETWTNSNWSFNSGAGNIGPQVVEIELNENLNSPNTYIAFSITGNHYQFDYWYIDDIEIEGMPTGAPLVTTHNPQNVTNSSAELKGEIVAQGDEPISASGFVFSTTPNLNIENENVTIIYTDPLVNEGNYTATIDNLNSATTYYYRAFAINSIATSYGALKLFSTLCGTTYLPYEQSFPTSEMPMCWEITNNGGTQGQVWQFGSFSSGLTGSSNYAFVNSDGYGWSGNQNTSLITPLVTIEGYSSITLQFKHYFRQWSNTSSGKVYYSVDNGNTWTQIGMWDQTTSNPSQFEYTIENTETYTGILFKWTYIGSYSYYWCVDDIEITGVPAGDPPVVVTLEPENIVSNAAVFKGTVNPNNLNTNAFFEWGLNDVSENVVQYDQMLSGQDNQTISYGVENLLPGKQYSYRVKATSIAGTTFGETVPFQTLNDTPLCSELSIDNLTSREVVFSFAILSDGGSAITGSGVCVSTEPNPSTEDIMEAFEPEEGAYTVTITELTPNTHYFARVYLENEMGVSYSNEVEFTTLLEVPSIVTHEASLIDSQSAYLRGELVSTWDALMEDIGFLVHNIPEFDRETDDVVILSTLEQNIQDGAGYSLLVNDLYPDSTYFYRAFAINAAGTGYGDVFSFTTWPLSISVDDAYKTIIYPNPTAGNIHISSPEKEILQAAVYDLTGKCVLNKTLNAKQNTLNINYVSTGVYILSLKYSDGFIRNYRVVKY